MMKYILKILLFIVSVSAFSQPIAHKFDYYKDLKLTYTMGYGFIKGGLVTISFKDVSRNDSSLHHIYLKVRTVGVFDQLYRIKDIYESYIDKETGYPVKAIRNIREGGYRRYNIVTYDHHIRTDSTVIQSGYSGEVVIPKNTFDILSSYYYMRHRYFTTPPNTDTIIYVDTYFTDEVFPITMSYVNKKTVKVKYGKRRCRVYSPVTEVGRVFKREDAMRVYISDDDEAIPIRLEFEFFLGTVRCDLISVKYGKN
jgi:hypothetical protein